MKNIALPIPNLDSKKNFRQTLQQRHSQRHFQTNRQLSLEQISDLLWATYGKKINNIDAITSASYVIPSAGAIYALEIYILIGKNSVKNLSEGLYHYIKENHSLTQLSDQDKRKQLVSACLGQKFIEQAPVSIIIAANFPAMAQRYGNRAKRYVILEAGHAAQNIYLIATDLNLGTVEVGAFDDDKLSEILDITYPVLLVMPVGYKK